MNALAESTENPFELAFEAVSQSGCGILIADTEARIVYVNKRLCDVTGYDAQELIGENPKLLQSGSTPRELYLILWNTISAGRPWHGELRNRRKNGEEWVEELTISPLKDHRGAITHYCAIVNDVTKQRLEESALADIERSASDSEKRESMAALTLGMAHDLNNFFTAILAAAGLGRKADDRRTLDAMFDNIEAATSRGIDYVRQMIQLWRPVSPEQAALDLNRFICDELPAFRAAAGAASLLLHGAEQPVVIQGNSDLIERAVQELIENARESEPAAPIELAVRAIEALEIDAAEEFISCGLSSLSVGCVEVRDRGRGMDPYVLRRAFNPFYSSKAAHKGLGLAKVRGIMAGHRGAIGVKSEQGAGTTVRLYFPTVPALSTGRY